MPFDATDHQRVVDRFAVRNLHVNFHAHPTDLSANLLQYNGRLYVGERFPGRFDDGFEGWRVAPSPIIAGTSTSSRLPATWTWNS